MASATLFVAGALRLEHEQPLSADQTRARKSDTMLLEPDRFSLGDHMRSIAVTLAGVFALGGAIAVDGKSTNPLASPAQPAAATPNVQVDVPAAAESAVAVVDQFGRALASGDLETAGTLLEADVLILEAGGAERSRGEYLGHHAISDAAFLKGTHSKLKQRRARIYGDMAWVGSESELHASKDGKPLTLLSTETKVLERIGAGWRIVHVHWSSRPKR